MPFTLQQEAAINHDRDVVKKSALVFASAGAGKTAVLVERLCKLIIEKKVSLKNIVAITFTNDAASSMRYKLQNALSKKIAEINDGKEKERLEKELSLINDANIATIDSFCLNIVKQYYYLSDIKSNAYDNILDNVEKKRLKNLAIKAVFDRYDTNKLRYYLSPNLFLDEKGETLRKMVDKIIDVADSKIDPLLWMDSISHEEKESLEVSDYQAYLDDLKKVITIAKDICVQMINTYAVNNEGNKDDELEEMFLTLSKASKAKDYDELISLLENKCGHQFTAMPKSHKCLKSLNDEYNEVMKELATKLISKDDFMALYNNACKYENKILDLAKEIYKEYNKIKKEYACVDFGDINHSCYQILTANNNELANKLKEDFYEIMVDEFQDTNDSQYEIIKLIAREDNLFLVGDIKQSIYRFRGAVPENMERLKSEYQNYNLPHNFRSKENIIEFNNEFFFNIFNDNKKGSFTESDKQDPNPFSKQEKEIEVKYLRHNKTVGEESESIARVNLLCNEIIKDYNSGTKFGDMAVLVESNDEKTDLKYYFRKYNIPYLIIDKEGYYRSMVFETLLAYLNLLNEKSNLNAIILLQSLFYELDLNELYECNKDKEDDKVSDNYSYLRCLGKEYEGKNKKLIQFNKDYFELRELVKENKINELLHKLINLNNFYYKLEDRERHNLNNFLLHLSSFKFKSVSELLHYIEDAKEDHQDVSSGTSSKDDVVRVMTIHASKGLDFDSVYILSKNSKGNRGNNFKTIDDELGISLSIKKDEKKTSPYLKGINEHLIDIKNREGEKSEYLRLYYVAATRAKRRLTFIAVCKLDEDTQAIKRKLQYKYVGFTNYLNAYFPSKLIEDIEELPTVTALKAPTIKYEVPEIKDYEVVEYDKARPSEAKNTKVNLNLDAYAGMEYGTRIHNILANINYSQEISKQHLLKLDNKLSELETERILAFCESELIKELLNKEYEFKQEFSFYYKEDGIRRHGYIDFLAIGEDIYLIDYKTDTKEDDGINEIKEETLIKRYLHEQQAYYDFLKKQYPNKKINAYLYSLPLKKFININDQLS